MPFVAKTRMRMHRENEIALFTSPRVRGEGGVRGRCRESERCNNFSVQRHRPLNPSFSPHAGRRSRERRQQSK